MNRMNVILFMTDGQDSSSMSDTVCSNQIGFRELAARSVVSVHYSLPLQSQHAEHSVAGGAENRDNERRVRRHDLHVLPRERGQQRGREDQTDEDCLRQQRCGTKEMTCR